MQLRRTRGEEECYLLHCDKSRGSLQRSWLFSSSSKAGLGFTKKGDRENNIRQSRECKKDTVYLGKSNYFPSTPGGKDTMEEERRRSESGN
jgi:hypothetical protein